MKNIIEICKEFGFEVPADKVADFNKAVAENYKTISEVEKKVSKIEAERDAHKERADTAEQTLKGFEGKDFDTITKERDEWKQKAEKAEKDYSDKMAAHEKSELLKEAFADYEFTSEAAKKAIMAQVSEGVTVKNGKLIGFNDLIDDAMKNDASAFVDKEQQHLEQNRPYFSRPKDNRGSGSNITRADILSVKDATERQRLIGQNPHLFVKEK